MLKITQTNSYLHLLFHYYVILPHKVKRTRKIRDPSTLYSSVLLLPGLQQWEYRRMQKEQLWLTESAEDILDTLTSGCSVKTLT